MASLLALLMSLLAAPSAEALAAKRPHGKVWSPSSAVNAGQKPVKGKNLTPAKAKAPAYPV
ncbi:hypothetical protein, partial [Kitasatospora sp. MBT63]|uniref:hypothetical protein n=1 Tax=Kitasatospora sp. MBT63 TaxID=1444768 RepID=UPI00053A5B97